MIYPCRPGARAQAETDYDYSNSSPGNANGVTLAVAGNQRTATVAGQIMAAEGSTQDADLFNLGALTAGNTVELTVRLPAGSTLSPVVRLLDSAGNVVVDGDAVPDDGHFSATLSAGGTYYAHSSG